MKFSPKIDEQNREYFFFPLFNGLQKKRRNEVMENVKFDDFYVEKFCE